MIYLGLDYRGPEKEAAVVDYLAKNPKIQNVVVFSPERFKMPDMNLNVSIEQYTYADIIKYVVFYPMLERVDDTYLIVVNECMRTVNRGDLTYNCLHHYLNQTRHRIIFEYLPFVNDVGDFMICLDNDQPNKYKNRSFAPFMLTEVDLIVRPHHFTLAPEQVELNAAVASKYAAEKARLLEGLGNSDPDTIPRKLALWSGKYKACAIRDDGRYVARNARFKKSNVVPYKSVSERGEYTVIDFAHRRLDFNDFLKVSGQEQIPYITTGLPVDKYYEGELREWVDRLEAFYAEAGICQQDR